MNIYGISISELEDFFILHSENKAKAKLLFKCLYKNFITDFKDITIFSDKIKLLISENFSIKTPKVLEIRETISGDTSKLLFEFHDKSTVEAVLMRHSYGNGLCISTQVGCNMGCVFCESGRYKKIRDLTSAEMVTQFVSAEKVLNTRITHVTLMGVGEPLDNFANVMKFINIIGNPHGLDIAKRHITISTCGLIPQIKNLLQQNTQSNLAVSLHAPNNDLRSELMPINKVYGINELIELIREYSTEKKRKTAVEYVMLKNINDSAKNAHELAVLLKGIFCYVNLIPYNETANSPFKRSDSEIISAFCQILLKAGIRATVRREFGHELGAACGQLRTNLY